MRGEDITPWETHYIAAAKTERAERSEPVLDIKLPRIKLSNRLPEVSKEYSVTRRAPCRRHLSKTHNKAENVADEVREIGGRAEDLKEK
jgi:hypothetical protein